MKTKPLIEKYMTHLRVSDETARARIKHEERLDGPGLNYNLVLLNSYTTVYMHMAESAQKYRMARSGLAMVETLRPRPLLRGEMSLSVLDAIASHSKTLDPDIATPVAQMPSAPIWIELAEPILTSNGEVAAFFFTCAAHELEYQLTLPQPRMVRSMLEESLQQHQKTKNFRWSLHFIDSNGIPKSDYEYNEDTQEWTILAKRGPCPTDECVIREFEDAEGFAQYQIIPCPLCATILAHWRSWFTTALLTVSGEFAETEATEWPVISEEVIRKVARPHSAKYDHVNVRHDYYLVTFDASVKKVKTQHTEEIEHRGSWVDAARLIDPDAIIYMRRGFGATERLLDPSINPRWKEKKVVPVSEHKRRVPMRVETLRKRITHVVASKYKDVDPSVPFV